MAEVLTPLIKVDVGESEKSVKGLKQEISDLRDKILNLTKGTDEYNEAVEQLQQNQRDLDNVMALTKKNATALEGSYDALTQQMSLLKKEWRATADEAKRADLGKQIDEINNQLKEMDASVGNFQRNVGNYVSHWEGMPEVTKDFGTSMREMSESIEPTKMKFESVGNIASGLASGFAAVQGAAALLGIENEDLEKTFVKLQAAMALAQGIGGLSGLVEGVGKAKVAFDGMLTSIKNVTKAMSATGWIAVIMAAIAVVAMLVSWIRNAKKSTDEYGLSLEKQKELNKDLSKSVGDVYAEYRVLKKEYEKLDSLKSKKKWIEDNASAFDALGLSISGVNDADRVFITQSEQVIAAMKARAKAEALKEKYKEAIVEAEGKKGQLKEQSVIYTGDGVLPELANADEWEYVWGGGQSGAGHFKPLTSDAPKNYLKAQEKAIDDAVDAMWGKRWEDAENAAKELETKIKGLVKGDDTLTLDDYLKMAAENMEPVVIEDIPIEIKDPEIKETNLGLYEKLANNRIASAERVAQREIDLNNASKLSDEEKAQKELEIRQRLEEEKLRILKEYKAKADETQDWQSQLELYQEIADAEVAITVAKNEAIIASEERRKEKQTEIITNISAALTAAGSITQGILDITQAAAEKDEEISEQEAKRIKGMQYATASINMLAGITAALSGCFTTKTGPWDWVLAGVQAASIAAAGTANLMRIRNTDITGEISSGAQTAVTPSSNVFGTDIPYSYTRQLTGASEVDSLNEPIKVYVTESDITDAVNHSKVRIEESSF